MLSIRRTLWSTRLHFTVLCLGVVFAGVVHAGGYDVRRFHQGSAPNDRYGLDVAILDDLNADGTLDYAIASPRFGVVEIRSGATGTIILTLSGTAAEDDFGISIARLEDQDGDGLSDLVVGAWLFDAGGVRDTGAAFIYSTATGALIDQVVGTVASEELGTTVADAGDVDGDGIHDVAIGAPGYSTATDEFAGRVLIYSTVTSSEIWSIAGGRPNGYLGREIAAAGDLDGDGMAEVAVGDPSGLNGSGRIDVHSGPTGSLFRTLTSGVPGETGFGRGLTQLVDRDGDGQPELGCVSRTPTSTVATVLSSVDGATLARPTAPFGTGFEMKQIYDANDFDLDTTPDLLVHSRGMARVYDSSGFALLDEWSTELLGLGSEVPAIDGPVDFDGDGRDEYLCGFSYLVGTAEPLLGGVALLERREPGFIRGDVVADASVDLADAIAILQYLFLATSADCLAAADLEDNGSIDITDAVLLLGYLFVSGSPPAAPFPDCGVDPTGPALPCGFSSCAGPPTLMAVVAPATATLPAIPPSLVFGFGGTWSSEAVVWCMDTSSSTALGGALSLIQEQVSASIAALDPWQTFDVVRYGGSVQAWSPELQHGSAANRLSAEDWVDDTLSIGSNCLESGLTESLAIATQSLRRERGVILVHVGDTTCDPAALLVNVAAANVHQIPIHVIHVTTGSGGTSLMQQIALQSGGTYVAVN